MFPCSGVSYSVAQKKKGYDGEKDDNRLHNWGIIHYPGIYIYQATPYAPYNDENCVYVINLSVLM